MKKHKISPGDVFGDLTVVREMPMRGVHRYFLCQTPHGGFRQTRLDRLTAKKDEKWSLPRVITFRGLSMTIGQWAQELGVKEATLRSRMRRMEPSEALAMGKAE